MRYLAPGLAAMALATTAAHAGGIDRDLLPYSILFEHGRVVELGFSNVTPEVSGSLLTLGGPLSTGNMAQSYDKLSLAFKGDFNDKLAYAVFINRPYGADAKYTTGAYTGLEAHWTSDQIAALLKYQVSDRVSVYGGLRYVTSKANILIPPQMLGPLGTYTATASSDSRVGYIIGAAYEIPDIALRVGVTYESVITHKFATNEDFTGLDGGGADALIAAAAAGTNSTTSITLPQSIALDFQSGIAKDTLLFGSVRWSEWSKWHVRPALYDSVVHDEVTGFDHNVTTYQLGIGRKLSDTLSVFARLGYEAPNHATASRLSPTDGMQSIGIGGSWTKDKVKITGGVEYVKLGDATDASGTKFSGNHALGVGVTVDFRF